jgi:hypothetical protein
MKVVFLWESWHVGLFDWNVYCYPYVDLLDKKHMIVKFMIYVCGMITIKSNGNRMYLIECLVVIDAMVNYKAFWYAKLGM